MRDEHLGKRRFVMEDADNGPLLQPHDLAFRHCRSRPNSPRLAGQATFAAEFIRPEECDDGFLPLLGSDGDFDLAFLDVENGIRRVPLREDNPILAVPADAPSLADFSEKGFWIERRSLFNRHRTTCSIGRRSCRLTFSRKAGST